MKKIALFSTGDPFSDGHRCRQSEMGLYVAQILAVPKLSRFAVALVHSDPARRTLRFLILLGLFCCDNTLLSCTILITAGQFTGAPALQ